MTTSRQWHDLLLLKRFGFGHDLESKPRNGDLALFCPACPQPGINISEEPAPDHKQCVYISLALYHRHCLINYFQVVVPQEHCCGWKLLS